MVSDNKINIWVVLRTILLCFIVFVTLYPFIHMVAVSFSGKMAVMSGEVTFYPKDFTLDVMEHVFGDKRIWVAYKNTIIYVVVGTAIALVFTTCGAYALSKRERCPFYKVVNILLIITMFFSGGMIPAYLAMTWLHLDNTIWAIVLPPAVSAWNVILMRWFFLNFPVEIEESGKIDGLNDIGILWYLVLPTSSAILATIGLFVAVSHWNSFFNPMIYLKDADKQPLQIILRQIILQASSTDQDVVLGTAAENISENGIKYATIIVSILPIILVYPFLQKYFVKGVMIGSVKG